MQTTLNKPTESLGRTPTLSEMESLRCSDRIIVEYSGRRRVAKVASHTRRKGVRLLTVWLHKTNGRGFVRGTVNVRRHQIKDITACPYLNIRATSDERALIGGAA